MKDDPLASIEKFSKADLIWITERVCHLGGKYAVQQAINSLECKKTLERLEKCDEINKKAAECRRKYISLLEPYEGKSLSEIPRYILEQAENEIDRARELDKQWNRLMKKC